MFAIQWDDSDKLIRLLLIRKFNFSFSFSVNQFTCSPYRPQNTPPPQRRPGGGASATNVRITKAILDSILLNPEHFTQITHDKPPHLCTFLKVSFIVKISKNFRSLRIPLGPR